MRAVVQLLLFRFVLLLCCCVRLRRVDCGAWMLCACCSMGVYAAAAGPGCSLPHQCHPQQLLYRSPCCRKVTGTAGLCTP